MNRVVSIVSLIALALGVPTEKIGKHRIINGENAVEGEFPYQVSLQQCYENRCWPWCGGTIISPKAVLTAAHCCISNYTYKAGVGSISEAVAQRNVIGATGFTSHEGYSTGQVVAPHDICIIHLEKSITYSTNVQPAALPISGVTPKGSAVVSGWGIINSNDTYPDHLQKAILHIININECEKFLKLRLPHDFQFQLEKNGGNICTFKRGLVSTCVGDSGGPLVQNGVLIGVVSWGFYPCGYAPSVYTTVSHYIDWIHRHTTDLHVKKVVDKLYNGDGDESGIFDKFVENLVYVSTFFNFLTDLE